MLAAAQHKIVRIVQIGENTRSLLWPVECVCVNKAAHAPKAKMAASISVL